MQFPNRQLRLAADLLFTDPDIKTVLNIGMRPDSWPGLLQQCEAMGIVFTILEVHGPYVKQLKAKYKVPVMRGNVCGNRLRGMSFDAVHWLHGPQQVTWGEFQAVDKMLREVARKHILYQMPIGSWRQGARHGNSHEAHKQALYPRQMLDMGYTVRMHNVRGESSFSAYLMK